MAPLSSGVIDRVLLFEGFVDITVREVPCFRVKLRVRGIFHEALRGHVPCSLLFEHKTRLPTKYTKFRLHLLA